MKHSVLLYLVLSSVLGYSQTSKKINSIKELTDSIEVIVHQRHIPGLMLGITNKDSVLFSGGFGYADVKTKRPVTNTTRFRMGSITKSFIAIAIQQLIEQGKLNLQDKLSKVAPEVPFQNQWESTHPVTIISLLENTTGFDDFKLNKMYTIEQKNYTTKEMMLLQKPSMICRWPPSERYTYCNVNYAILGYIIQKLTGMEYDTYLRQNILIPLQMSHSGFELWSRFPDTDAKEYIYGDDGFTAVPSVTLMIGAAGSLWSTSDDMIRFLQFYIAGGQPILSPESMAIMEQPGSSLAVRAGLKSGYAKGNEYFGTTRGHSGYLGTFRSVYQYNRESNYGFVIASNGNGLADIENLINDYFTKNRQPKEIQVQPLDKKAITPYLGYYQLEDPRYDLMAFTDRLMLVKIGIENDTLYFTIMGQRHELLQCGPLTFTQPGVASPGIVFTVNSAGTKVLILNQHYAEKAPAFTALGYRFVLLIAVVFMFLSVIIGIIALISFLMGKINWQQLQIKILPAVSILFLLWGINSFLEVKSNAYLLYQLTMVSYNSVAIFLGISLFGILAVLNLVLLIKRFRSVNSRVTKYCLLLIALSLMLLFFILLRNGWIGLMTWTL